MLKELFNKAKTAIDTKVKPAVAKPFDVKEDTFLDLIVVPRSAMNAYPENPVPLVEAVVDYVNFLFQHALFTRDEIATEALQLYHCDYYLAQVRNGGHAQLIGNPSSMLSKTMSDVMGGLAAMGADGHFGIAQTVASWAAQHPDQDEDQLLLDHVGKADLLDLDTRFAAQETKAPLRVLFADWISQFEVLQVVDDVAMARVLKGIKALNPNAHQRGAKSRLAKLLNQLSSPVSLGLGMASAIAVDPMPVLSLGTGTEQDVDGETMVIWPVETASGSMIGTQLDGGAQLCSYVSDEFDSDEQNVDLEVLSSVTETQIKSAQQVCESLNAAIAIELLLSKLPFEATADFVSVRSASPNTKGVLGASIFVVVNNAAQAYTAIIEEVGCRLLSEPTHDELVQVTAQELASYVAALAAD